MERLLGRLAGRTTDGQLGGLAWQEAGIKGWNNGDGRSVQRRQNHGGRRSLHPAMEGKTDGAVDLGRGQDGAAHLALAICMAVEDQHQEAKRKKPGKGPPSSQATAHDHLPTGRSVRSENCNTCAVPLYSLTPPSEPPWPGGPWPRLWDLRRPPC